MELLTGAQMRAIERAAIDSGEVTGLELMERAGQGVVEAIFDKWPELAPMGAAGREASLSSSPRFSEQGEEEGAARRAVVLCGPGNNGGDGFVIARLLHGLGWTVEVLFWGDLDKLPGDARVMHDAWSEVGPIVPLTMDAAASGLRPVLMVDALLGIGANRALPLEIGLAHHAIEKRDVGATHPWLKPFHVVSVDCPSGMDSDSGQFLMPTPPEQTGDDEQTVEDWWRWWSQDAQKRLLRTDFVVTFHRLKPAHVMAYPVFKTKVVDIGLGAEDTHPSHLLMPHDPDIARLIDADFGKKFRKARMWPGSLVAKTRGHKFEFGHVLALSGGAGKTGAARLAARAALRVGAGLVTLGVPGSAQIEVASHVTSLMLAQLDDADALQTALNDPRISSLCLGPGLGFDRARALVPAVLASGRRVVLDADALSAFADDPGALFDVAHPGCVMTPHAGEFERLFPDLARRLKEPATRAPVYSKLDATRDAARRAGCIILFKSVDSVIAHPDGRCSIHAAIRDNAVPWLAIAGAGDVLAGLIAGLLARPIPNEIDIMAAVEVAVWLHVQCARSFGPGLIAEDLPEELPKVLRQILQS